MKLEAYLNAGVSPFHVVQTVKERLTESGFEEISFGADHKLAEGKGYLMTPYPSVLFAFRIDTWKRGMHIAAAHTDWPAFKLKPQPDIKDSSYLRVNTEPYGGMLKRTWFDRPLGLAGKVMLRNVQDPYHPGEVLFDSGAPWLIIPSLAPHLDREIETREIDAQKVLMPLYGTGQEGSFMEKVAEKLGVAEEEILDYDLYLYNMDPAQITGADSDLLCAPRIDNIASVAALTEGIAQVTEPSAGISLIALFDNEEIGSRSKQGADSELLRMVLEHIRRQMGLEGSIADVLAESMLLSVDGAHAMHPNYKDKSDETARAFLGGGVVLKTSAGQRYVTDSRASAIIKGLCAEHGITLQQQANRSGAPGGQTLGPIASSYLPMLAADLGIPMLAMHSARELAHIRDYEALEALMRVFL